MTGWVYSSSLATIYCFLRRIDWKCYNPKVTFPVLRSCVFQPTLASFSHHSKPKNANRRYQSQIYKVNSICIVPDSLNFIYNKQVWVNRILLKPGSYPKHSLRFRTQTITIVFRPKKLQVLPPTSQMDYKAKQEQPSSAKFTFFWPVIQ